MVILTHNTDDTVHDDNCLMFERFPGRSNKPHESVQAPSLGKGFKNLNYRGFCITSFTMAGTGSQMRANFDPGSTLNGPPVTGFASWAVVRAHSRLNL